MSCLRTLYGPLLSLDFSHVEKNTLCEPFDQKLIAGFFLTGVATLFASIFIIAPYGRFGEMTKLFKVPGKFGWIVQESMSWIFFLFTFIKYSDALLHGSHTTRNLLTAVMYLTHYFHRSLVYPLFRAHSISGQSFYTFLSAVLFCAVNGYQNAKWLIYSQNEPTFHSTIIMVVGFSIWLFGFYFNYKSDQTLIDLRNNNKDKTQKYFVPTGGLYNYVSSANYLSEIIEWIGFAIATNHCASIMFAFWTASNLIPRAVSIHNWYLEKFPGKIPKHRKAVIPYIL
ncbi:3-oxo-5-alpha-steroid 4-dehydrogenase [Acrasis kona]|uniref:3-oxo-5-alpha-steroid 4-dehydrogenase n=1 Tax=Acrasis kona TaxID=1008807 RepID=A0AAW2ZKI4_9EUKA